MNRKDAAAVRRGGANGGMVILGMIVGVLIVQGILRLWLAMGLLISPGIEGQFGALVHWRIYDSFAGWVGILVLAMAENDRRLRRAELITLGVGLVGMTVGLLLGDVSGRAIVEIGVAAMLAAGTVMVALRQIMALGRAAGKVGLDVEQLWRGVALQWALLWVTAEVALRVRFWRDGIEAEGRARSILFLVPVAGMVPNVMMAMGIRWWDRMRGMPAARPRVRAWLVAIVGFNVGAALVVASVWVAWLSAIGAVLMVAGVGMYFVGFPRGAWKSGGWMVIVAFCVLVIGLGMMAFDGVAQRELYSAAWRHLMGAAGALWLVGMGGVAVSTIVSERVRPRGAALASAWMLVMGVLATSAVLIAEIQDRSMLQGLFVGTGIQVFGVIVGGAALLRAGRGVQGPALRR